MLVPDAKISHTYIRKRLCVCIRGKRANNVVRNLRRKRSFHLGCFHGLSLQTQPPTANAVNHRTATSVFMQLNIAYHEEALTIDLTVSNIKNSEKFSQKCQGRNVWPRPKHVWQTLNRIGLSIYVCVYVMHLRLEQPWCLGFHSVSVLHIWNHVI